MQTRSRTGYFSARLDTDNHYWKTKGDSSLFDVQARPGFFFGLISLVRIKSQKHLTTARRARHGWNTRGLGEMFGPYRVRRRWRCFLDLPRAAPLRNDAKSSVGSRLGTTAGGGDDASRRFEDAAPDYVVDRLSSGESIDEQLFVHGPRPGNGRPIDGLGSMAEWVVGPIVQKRKEVIL